MLVDIAKIVVGDRIRKDFGDIEELADDIKENGLINPPVVNKNYELLAGERRLRACKMLGWPQIEVRMMDTRDAEHELNIEISENDVRKGFSKSERLDYIQRLYRIEQAKARERQDLGLKSDEGSRADDATAKQFGIGRDTMRRELYIDANKEWLNPADFAEWDEGKLSTNKAFQRIKAAQKRAEEERDAAMSDAEMTSMLYGQAKTQLAETQGDLESAKEELASERGKNLELGSQMESLKRQLAERPEPEVIEREVEVEVEVESKEAQRRIRELEHLERIHHEDTQKLRKRNEELRKELDRARDILGLDKTTREIQHDVQYLITATNQYVRHYGGLTWTVQSLSEVDEPTIEELHKAVRNLATFANTLMNCLEEING